MRELTGNLVACEGGEPAVARMAADISQQFQCERFRRKRFQRKPFLRPRLLCKEDRAAPALTDAEQISIGAAVGKTRRAAYRTAHNVPTDRVWGGRPLSVFHAGAMPCPVMLD